MPARSPNFLFIGPDKSGSTWLYEALRQHRQVFLPSVKELFFFDQFYDKGWSWYSRYFQNAGEQHHIVAEICHDYLFSPLACQRIAHELPSAKLMVCLRDPSQRAFSEYLYMLKVGLLTCDFETALKQIDHLVDNGCYVKHLSRYLEHFNRNQIHVAIFDDFAADPQRFFDSVCDFLRVEHATLPKDLKLKVLPAAKPRLRHVAKFARSMGWKVRQMGLPEVVGKIRESPLLNRVLYSPYGPSEKPEMPLSARKYLRQIFSSEVRRLDALLGARLYDRWGYTSGD